MKKRSARLGVAFLFLGTLAVGVLAPNPTIRAQPRPTPGSVALGVAVTPKNFPSSTPEDVSEAFRMTKDLGDYAVFICQWSKYNLQEMREVVAVSRQNGLEPLVAISPTSLDHQRRELDVPADLRRKVGKGLSFQNPAVRDAFKKAAVELAGLDLHYLCLATEINFLAFRGDQEYAHFAGLYKEAYDEVKRIAPGTKVFVSFQWDVARKLDEDQPAAMAEHAKHIEIFRPGLDILALTSYPALLYESPAKLPEDYYAAVGKYVRKGEDVIYMELGWPGGGKGSDTQQAEYMRRLPGLMNGVKPAVMAWALLHDVNVFPADIGTSGLLTHEGGKRSGYEAWKALKGGAPRHPRSSPTK